MPIRIIAVGKKHESWVEAGIARYEKRLQRPFTLSWTFVSHSAYSAATQARKEESQRVLRQLSDNDFVVLLDERGKLLDSPGVSKLVLQPLEASRTVVCIIGGAYGVDDTVHTRANYVWSLSPLVFPHQLVRLLLVEQLYRAQEIAANNPYHHA